MEQMLSKVFWILDVLVATAAVFRTWLAQGMEPLRETLFVIYQYPWLHARNKVGLHPKNRS